VAKPVENIELVPLDRRAGLGSEGRGAVGEQICSEDCPEGIPPKKTPF